MSIEALLAHDIGTVAFDCQDAPLDGFLAVRGVAVLLVGAKLDHVAHLAALEGVLVERGDNDEDGNQHESNDAGRRPSDDKRQLLFAASYW